MEPGGGVRRAVPHGPAEWTRVCGMLSGFLADLAEADRDRGVLPAPLGGGVGVRAWGRLCAALTPARAAASPGSMWLQPRLAFVTVDPVDIAVLGAAARRLGRTRLPEPSLTPGHAWTGEAVRRAAQASSTTPPRVVVELARVHGVLDLDLGQDMAVLRRWGADGPVLVRPPGAALAAHRRIAGRVHTMWVAGAPSREDGAW
ncbi:MAG: hypothetical protein OJJ54_16225 [Pseudonocardia sp.]|nr:hypothetical protein [Pseudonocardia sp.]